MSVQDNFLLIVVKRTANIDSGYIEVVMVFVHYVPMNILGHEFEVASERLEKPVCSNL